VVRNTEQNCSDNFPSYPQDIIIARKLSVGGKDILDIRVLPLNCRLVAIFGFLSHHRHCQHLSQLLKTLLSKCQRCLHVNSRFCTVGCCLRRLWPFFLNTAETLRCQIGLIEWLLAAWPGDFCQCNFSGFTTDTKYKLCVQKARGA